MVFEPPTQARVDEIELKFRTVEQQGQHPMPMRVVASSKTGQWLKIDSYKEFPEPITGMAMYFCSLDNADRCYLEPYTISSDVEIKRATARRIGTTYVYDFLGLTEKSLIQRWDAYVSERPALKRPDMLFEASELGLDEDGKLQVSVYIPPKSSEFEPKLGSCGEMKKQREKVAEKCAARGAVKKQPACLT